MHPVITQQLVSARIREIHAKAETERRARQARRPRRRAPSIRLSGVVAGVLGVVHTFGEQRSALVRRARWRTSASSCASSERSGEVQPAG